MNERVERNDIRVMCVKAQHREMMLGEKSHITGSRLLTVRHLLLGAYPSFCILFFREPAVNNFCDSVTINRSILDHFICLHKIIALDAIAFIQVVLDIPHTTKKGVCLGL